MLLPKEIHTPKTVTFLKIINIYLEALWHLPSEKDKKKTTAR